MDQASGDWIFYLDPDERIPSEMVEEIREIVASETGIQLSNEEKKPLLREMAEAWKRVRIFNSMFRRGKRSSPTSMSEKPKLKEKPDAQRGHAALLLHEHQSIPEEIRFLLQL